jgi:hypothetical protein
MNKMDLLSLLLLIGLLIVFPIALAAFLARVAKPKDSHRSPVASRRDALRHRPSETSKTAA